MTVERPYRRHLRRAWHHIGAMHASGFALLVTFLVPPYWMLSHYGEAPPDHPTADFNLVTMLVAVPLWCAVLHVAVQIPAGLLGTRLARGRTRRGAYGITAGIAMALILLYAALTRLPLVDGTLLWLDSAARVLLSLWAYRLVVRPLSLPQMPRMTFAVEK